MRGFTLIEVTVYLALLSIILSGAIPTAYYLMDTGRRTESKITTNEERNFIVGTFEAVAKNLSNGSYTTNEAYSLLQNLMSTTDLTDLTINKTENQIKVSGNLFGQNIIVTRYTR